MKSIICFIQLLGCTSLVVGANWFITTQYSDASCTTPIGYSIIKSPICGAVIGCTEGSGGQSFNSECLDETTDPFSDRTVPDGWLVFKLWETNTGSCTEPAPNNFFGAESTCAYYGENANFKLSSTGCNGTITLTYHQGSAGDCSQTEFSSYEISASDSCQSLNTGMVAFDVKSYCSVSPPVAAPTEESPVAGPVSGAPSATPSGGSTPTAQQTPSGAAPTGKAPETKTSGAATVGSGVVMLGLVGATVLLVM